MASASAQNSTPISAEAPATRSHHTDRFHKNMAEPIAVMMKAMYASHAEGTWTYMMRTRSPMSLSSGDHQRPSRIKNTMPTIDSAPRTRVPRDDVLRQLVPFAQGLHDSSNSVPNANAPNAA